MSAPDTNIDRQKKRHRGPLIGIAIGALFAFVLFGYFMSEQLDADAPLTDEAAGAVATDG